MSGAERFKHLLAFKKTKKNGKTGYSNFILSNGTRSAQRDLSGPTTFDHMIPKDALEKIRLVTIYNNSYSIVGFSFFDKDGALLWQHGLTICSGFTKETVMLEENEVIVGVEAKLCHGNRYNHL